MVVELAVAMLACARLGAVHSIVFGGFSPTALSDRIVDSACKILITTDGGYRGANPFRLKQMQMKQLVLQKNKVCGSILVLWLSA